MKPTDEKIAAEIRKLREMKPRVRKYSVFGDNHHAAIDAQIDVLENRTTCDEIWDDCGDAAENVRDSMIEAANWLEDDSELLPSAGWVELIQD